MVVTSINCVVNIIYNKQDSSKYKLILGFIITMIYNLNKVFIVYKISCAY